MSFTRLLAAGRSIIGIKKAPGPYRMNQDHLLPKFGATHKAPVISPDSDMADVAELSQCEDSGSDAPAAVAVENDSRSLEDSQPVKRGVFARLKGRLGFLAKAKRRIPAPGRKAAAPRPVQTELFLGAVKVVRNDLTDSDFELVASRRAVSGGKSTGNGQPLGMVWNRLSARLLRQAAQQFDLVQKQRGKLLSQPGPGDGGSVGP